MSKLLYQIHIRVQDYSRTEPKLKGFPEVMGTTIDEQVNNAFHSLQDLLMQEEIGFVERHGRYAVLTTESIVEFQEARAVLAKLGFNT
jgi:hypothetical protein